jgi:HEAT repeat protein
MIKKTLAVTVFLCAALSAATLEENFNDFLHYTAIGRYEIAASYADRIIASNPDPVEMLELSQANERGYSILLKLYNENEQLKDAASEILDIIENGRFIKRTDPEIINAEIRRLSTTIRGRIAAEQRLKNSGEFAVPYMLSAIADESRKSEMPYISAALGKMGRDAVRPLCAALQMDNIAVKEETIRALGSIGYPEALPHLRFVVENEEHAELVELARKNIEKLSPQATTIPAAKLFYDLAVKYYYHAESLNANADFSFANVWFWDATQKMLRREKVDRGYFYELMAMRNCEWSLKANPDTGEAIALWLDAYFEIERTEIALPEYFGAGHADAMTYAVTAGPEYLHQALARSIKDKNSYITLNLVEALAKNSGEASLLQSYGASQPLVSALEYDSPAVQLSAAIALGGSKPARAFVGSTLIIDRLNSAITRELADQLGDDLAYDYANRAFVVLKTLAVSNNKVVDIAGARDALIKVITGDDDDMRISAAQVLAYLGSEDSQRAIADVALSNDFDIDVRIAVFASLIESAKINSNKLTDKQIDTLYQLTAARDIEPELREAAASAYGSLNLPSRKVKTLILDQARS